MSGNFERIFCTRCIFTVDEWLRLAFIRIGIFSTISENTEITETWVHQTSFTSKIEEKIRTIDNLLFREISKNSLVDGRGRFGGSDGRESPTRSTLTLIFDFLNFTLFNPIYSTVWCFGEINFIWFFLFRGFESKVYGFEFFIS